MPEAFSAPAESDWGARVTEAGVFFDVWSGAAERIWLCLFDAADRETQRLELSRDASGRFSGFVSGAEDGTRYGLRADGPYAPGEGLWFDPAKLLTDPYAVEIDRPYRYDARLAATRDAGIDTAPLMPKSVMRRPLPPVVRPPQFRPGGLIYEAQVRALTIRHPGVPEADRGTLRGLAAPAVIDHLVGLGVDAVELMPVTAWIDERHLAPLGLTNAWGYNPVSFMALDPRLAPGGLADLRAAIDALRDAGIGTILDLVFNHTGESDALGPTLSLRGLDARAYFRHRKDPPGQLVNDTGTGNTLACDHPAVRRLVLDSLRHFVRQAGVDGFRFDLGTVLGRTEEGFDPQATLFQEMTADPILRDRVLIAEPWDIGSGGYQLGRFPASFLEWNDRYRDDMRRFWRGDPGGVAGLATRLAGSSDIFAPPGRTRSVNFLAAHDGFSLADLVAYERKHNQANGEENRDGHDDNLSWNNGVEGASDDPEVRAARSRDLEALLATLFCSRGSIMLTAGDEFGRSQAGNNNAYAQDNPLAWLDWEGRDRALEDRVRRFAALRRRLTALAGPTLLTGAPTGEGDLPDVAWYTEAGDPMDDADWHDASRRALVMVLASGAGGRVAVAVNGARQDAALNLPVRPGYGWANADPGGPAATHVLPARSCTIFEETPRE